jgi:hypothetical protein
VPKELNCEKSAHGQASNIADEHFAGRVFPNPTLQVLADWAKNHLQFCKQSSQAACLFANRNCAIGFHDVHRSNDLLPKSVRSDAKSDTAYRLRYLGLDVANLS